MLIALVILLAGASFLSWHADAVLGVITPVGSARLDGIFAGFFISILVTLLAAVADALGIGHAILHQAAF